MDENRQPEDFSLLGGPLHRLGSRLGLVRGENDTTALGVALGGFLWLVLIALALVEGFGQRTFSLASLGGHVRLLVVIPLFFLCEAWVAPRMTTFVRMIARAGIVPEGALPELKSEITRVGRWKESWRAEALCLLAAMLMTLLGPQLPLQGITAAHEADRSIAEMSMTGYWYWIISLTVFRFLMFRWLWRLGLWCHFLARMARLPLKLIPTHPDYAAGLGYLEVVQTHFIPLILAISVLESSSYAEEISQGSLAIESLYPSIALILGLDAVLFLGPLFIFAPRLWKCRIKGLADYMEFAADYVARFDRKWLGKGARNPEALLGTSDLQSLADLGNSIELVRNMRWVPMSLRLSKDIVLAALLPMLPLLLFKYPITDLVQKFFARLTGF